MYKSLLLNRLLNNKEVFPHPPPKKFSYPWYCLIEDGKGIAVQVWYADDFSKSFTDYEAIYIEQLPWKVIKKISESECYAVYPYNYKDSASLDVIEKFSNSVWHVKQSDDGSIWIIKKMDDVDI
jgi:hypothetical protein